MQHDLETGLFLAAMIGVLLLGAWVWERWKERRK